MRGSCRPRSTTSSRIRSATSTTCRTRRARRTCASPSRTRWAWGATTPASCSAGWTELAFIRTPLTMRGVRRGGVVQGPRWTLGVAAAACLLLLAPLAGASNSVWYLDATGDGVAEAPDLGEIHVSNSDSGQVVFRISITNRVSLAPTDMVAVFVDADGKAGTGCARGVFGAEYALDVLAGRHVFGRCVG